MLAEHEAKTGKAIHLESFGGCMLGQLCPPSLLIAISILEGLFFMHHGVRDLSLSYAQQVSFRQDLAAIKVLRGLAERFLHGSRSHVVLYTYMGVFPRTVGGASDLLAQSARLAAASGAMRLIVKTPAEAHRIPTVQENIASLEHASEIYETSPRDLAVDQALVDEIGEEALSLIEAVLNLDADLDKAIAKAFASGLLDVPYCLHDDNANASRAFIDQRGLLRWQSPGRMPIRIGKRQEEQMIDMVDPFAFLGMLKSIERRYDAPYLAAPNPIFVTARAEA
jgi:methylaspartate mutase epsilon subunit